MMREVKARVGELAMGNVAEIHGGNGDDLFAGGFLGDVLFGDAGNDTIGWASGTEPERVR